MNIPLNTILSFQQPLLRRVLSSQSWSRLLGFVLLFLGTALSASAVTGFGDNFVLISRGRNKTQTTQTTYSTNNNNASAGRIQGQFLGSFDRNNDNTDSLYVNAKANTVADEDESVRSVTFLYRVYRTDNSGTKGDFIPIALKADEASTGSNVNWQSVGNRLNILNLNTVTSPGTYTLELYFQADVNTGNNGSNIILDNNQHYTAQFRVTFNGATVVATTWNGPTASVGNATANWFTASYWSNNLVPNSNTDVTIPFISGIAYPTIESGTALARNITIATNTNDNSRMGARLFLGASNRSVGGGQLYVYGNFQDNGGGFVQNDKNSLLSFEGRSQAIDARNFTVINMRVTGGGDKSISGDVSVRTQLIFQSVTLANGSTSRGGNLVTNASAGYGVVLSTSDAQLVTESDNGYVLGVVTKTSLVSPGNPITFGNIGATLTTTGNPGIVTARRLSAVYTGVGTSVSIRRSFTFLPDEPESGNFSLIFRYLTPDLNGIEPQDLRLFRSETADVPFENLGGTAVNNSVTVNNISGTLGATFTLGDRTNPLPVTLVSFTGLATAKGVALTWLTASEENNKGFGVERQLAGSSTWQQVGYVQGTNLAAGSRYQYLDATLPASATQAYYRLRQEDIDGVQIYSPVVAISQTAGGVTNALTLSPVPLKDGPLTVAFVGAEQAGSEVLVLNMQGQRVLRYTTTAGSEQSLSLPVGNLAAGVYILSVQVPGQAAQRARFVKE